MASYITQVQYKVPIQTLEWFKI